jgi:hypothetical protein
VKEQRISRKLEIIQKSRKKSITYCSVDLRTLWVTYSYWCLSNMFSSITPWLFVSISCDPQADRLGELNSLLPTQHCNHRVHARFAFTLFTYVFVSSCFITHFCSPLLQHTTKQSFTSSQYIDFCFIVFLQIFALLFCVFLFWGH